MACSCVGAKIFAKKDVGRAPLGRRRALPGPMGQCAPGHSIHLLECPAWRALFLHYQERGGFLERSAVQAGNAQGVCADWSALFGSRR